MANISQVEADVLLKASLCNVAYTPATTWFLALDTVHPADNNSAATEVTGGSYARLPIAFNTTLTHPSNVSTTASTNAQSYTNMPAVTVVSVEVFSLITGTVRRLWFGDLTAPKTTASGDTLSFAIGAVTVGLS